MQTTDEVLNALRTMFRSMLAASAGGGGHARLSRARGCVDGYMQALLDLGVATHAELLELIAGERERANGPAVGVVEPPEEVSGIVAGLPEDSGKWRPQGDVRRVARSDSAPAAAR